MAITPVPADYETGRDPAGTTTRAFNVAVDRAVLFAGHAECPGCRAFIRRLTPLGERSMIGELIAGWCDVCNTTTFFAPPVSGPPDAQLLENA